MMDKTKLPSRGRRVNHGLGGTPTYRSWYSMLQRCTNPRDLGWTNYGGRGIKVCDEWLTIEGFVRDMGLRPVGMSLDRIDTDGNYEPGNCRWATVTEQNRNRTYNVVNPEKLAAIRCDLAAGLSQKEAADRHGVSQSTVSRASRGVTWGGM
jgi:hypothetical protein